MNAVKLVALMSAAAVTGAGAMWAFVDGRGETPPVTTSSSVAPPPLAQDDGLIGARTRGSTDALVTIYEVSDFQCPFCRTFWEETLPTIEREYIETGKVRLIFLNFPIAQLHPNAPAAHEFAMCAARQDLFWPVHDLLFRYQQEWGKLDEPGPYFRTLADSASLSRELLEECFETGAVRGIIADESQSVWRAGINSTPSFMIEGGLLAGAQPIKIWRPILDSLLERKK